MGHHMGHHMGHQGGGDDPCVILGHFMVSSGGVMTYWRQQDKGLLNSTG